MDPAVKASLDDLARLLLSNTPTGNPLDALSLLGSLESVTRQSLGARKRPLPKPAPATNAAPVPVKTPGQPVQYSSNREEYQPALGDQSLIQALMDYYKTTGVPAPKPAPAPKAPSAAEVAPPVHSHFQAMEVPAVQAAPKTNSVPRKSLRPGYPVLRPGRPDNTR